MVTLEEAKNYLRINFDNDDEFIKTLLKTSEQTVKEQTGVEYNDNDEIYKLAILLLTAHYYDKRESFADKSANKVPYTLETLIQHIGMRGTYTNE